MSILVRTPLPFATESLIGFVLRVSEHNGYDTPWHLLRLAGIDQGKMQTAGFPLERFASIIGQNVDSLLPLAYQTGEDSSHHFKILGHNLGKSLKNAPLRLRKPAFCPRCVEAQGYIDAFWDLSAAVACPQHRCLALQHCPKCCNAIRWYRPGLLTCSCGACFSEAISPGVDGTMAEMMGIIQAKLQGRALTTLPNTAGFPVTRLEQLPLWSLLHILDVLGVQNSPSRETSASEKKPTIAAGIEPLEQWPEGYHRFLIKLGNQFLAEKPSALGLRKQFGPFYYSMFKNRMSSGDVAFLRDEFINFGLLHWGHAVVDIKLLRSPKSATVQRFISKTEFTRRFGIWKPTMDRMIADGAVVMKKITVGKSVRGVVDLELSQSPVESMGIVTERDAAYCLGLPVSVLKHLRDTGIFFTKPRFGHEQSWHEDDVKAFLARGLSMADICSPSANKVALKDVMRLKLRDTKAKADIVVALFDGRLTVTGRVEGNLGGLLLDKAQLGELVVQKRFEVEGNSYSQQETAAQTGLDFTVIANAIKLGLLSGENSAGRLRIPSSSVDCFNAEYVTLSRLATKLGTLAQHLWRKCRQNGIPVVTLSRSRGLGDQPILLKSLEGRLVELWQKELASRANRKLDNKKRDCQSAYEATLRKFLENLGETGKQLPRRAGEPNKAVIARACGFSRDVLYSYPTVFGLLDDFDKKERQQVGIDILDAGGALYK